MTQKNTKILTSLEKVLNLDNKKILNIPHMSLILTRRSLTAKIQPREHIQEVKTENLHLPRLHPSSSSEPLLCVPRSFGTFPLKTPNSLTIATIERLPLNFSCLCVVVLEQ